MGLRCRVAVLALLLATAMACPSTSVALSLGFDAGAWLFGGTDQSQSIWLNRIVAEGAQIVRVDAVWSAIAPVKPTAQFSPSDPASPGYNWSGADAAVRRLTSHGVRVLMSILDAPSWAEGKDRPRGTRPGSWRPSAAQFGAFANAAARRYSGTFPDPLAPGRFLPRVRLWQAWNEPNLDTYISPQWVRRGHGYAPESPVIYRHLLNAFYAGVKKVSRANFVVSAGTAPYGDGPGGQRIRPVEFDRELFCLRGVRVLRPVGCHDPVYLDAISHHPYGVAGPFQTAYSPDDAAVPDVTKVGRVLRAAERTGHVLPRGHKRLWVTEISWDSNPPDPQGVPIDTQARWLEQSLYVLWRQGVDTVLWLQLQDSPPSPDYASTNQGGTYYLDGRAKPAAQAYAFPFVAQRTGRSQVRVWGRAPERGTVVIEALRGRNWTTLRRLAVNQQQVFTTSLSLRGRSLLRARVGPQASLPWTQGA